MLRFSFAVVLFSGILAICASKELYDDKYDYLDPLDIVTNERLRVQYLKCFLETGPCVTADAKFFKTTFPDAVVTKCVKCTEKQKAGFETIVDWYVQHRPKDWEAMITKFIADAKAGKTSSA